MIGTPVTFIHFTFLVYSVRFEMLIFILVFSKFEDNEVTVFL